MTVDEQLPDAVLAGGRDHAATEPPTDCWGFGATGGPRLFGRMPLVARQPWKLARVEGLIPDTQIDAARVSALELRAVSARGPAHRYEGIPRQDAYALARSADDRYLVAVVCDGLGSADHSHMGACAAARTASEYAARQLEQSPDLSEAALSAVYEAACAVEDVATGRGQHPSRFATTLTLVVLDAVGDDAGHAFVLVTVGDSPALVLDPAGRLRPFPAHAMQADDDDDLDALHTSTTRCLPMHHADAVLTNGLLPRGATLVLASDGFGLPALEPSVSEWLSESWSTPPGLEEVLIDVQFLARSYDDDRTAVAIWADR